MGAGGADWPLWLEGNGAFQKQLHKSLENNRAPHDSSAVPGKTNQPLLNLLGLQWSEQRAVRGFGVLMHILGPSVLSLFPHSLFSGRGLSCLLLFQRPAGTRAVCQGSASPGNGRVGSAEPPALTSLTSCTTSLSLDMSEMCLQQCNSWKSLEERKEGVGGNSFNTFQQFCSTENIFKEKLFVSSTGEGVWL